MKNMKPNFGFSAIAVGAFALALGLAACGDGESSNGPANDDDSSSSSVILSGGSAGVEGSSSSSAKSSSSVASSSSMKAAWAYLNPDIDYGEFTDERDGQVYKTVKICDKNDENCQTWMAENLNYDPGDVSDMGDYAWSGCYDNESANCDKYGRLYTWEVAMDDASCAYGNSCNPSGIVQGVCPAGWHLPTKEDWQKLVKPMATSVDDYTTFWDYYGAGVELKTVDGWNPSSNENKGTNASGFSALPAGYSYYYGESGFDDAGYRAYFWSATQRENDSDSAYGMYLYYYDVSAYLGYYGKDYGFSVRCLQNSN
ncbi:MULTISPECIES: fibrobacter succinogenes major paralogous domain-containing protein [unclassified Fibrobacter]|uniref:fibrobacter succinogenes major paralogous domain-containing protein n=1 Tax=unclassified Fibrobacter TaxID=2634177 RepID=UPI000D7A3073|nr:MULTISPECIES: fibrobacter succinogenes major paralogous domain-containing protein [unclassified Fibrobacter]PWJ59112.1 uncharacterized protein (TIGR02145 family) [Fibrobacter sp. UWR4]PZW62959.1 uncharacterized protein (TIGR02145 family) [Fibrobacter sp. UWR1]